MNSKPKKYIMDVKSELREIAWLLINANIIANFTEDVIIAKANEWLKEVTNADVIIKEKNGGVRESYSFISNGYEVLVERRQDTEFDEYDCILIKVSAIDDVLVISDL